MSTPIPATCTTWYDGCNICIAKNGKAEACTQRFCHEPDEPRCSEYNCRSREGWTSEKTDWCCKNKDLGCPQPKYNCRTRDLWTTEKTEWCCTNKNLGCPQPEYNCLTRELWTGEKTEWCCKNQNLGCPEETLGTNAPESTTLPIVAER